MWLQAGGPNAVDERIVQEWLLDDFDMRLFGAIDYGAARARARAVNTKTTFSNPYTVVIVVDDDTAVRNSLKFSLEIEGFAVANLMTKMQASSLSNLVRMALVAGILGPDASESG